MEQERISTVPPETPPEVDREIFQRVWRRVMPEDRDGCPIVLAEEPPTEQAQPPAVLAPAALAPAPAPEQRAEEDAAEDLPCLGASCAVYGGLLQGFIDEELRDFKTYQLLARRAAGKGGRVLASIAADERRHAKRLSAVYFLISGVHYWPVERAVPARMGSFLGALRERFGEEQRGEQAYLAAAGETTDPCLRELYRELAGDEDAHAWLLRGILEDL